MSIGGVMKTEEMQCVSEDVYGMDDGRAAFYFEDDADIINVQTLAPVGTYHVGQRYLVTYVSEEQAETFESAKELE